MNARRSTGVFSDRHGWLVTQNAIPRKVALAVAVCSLVLSAGVSSASATSSDAGDTPLEVIAALTPSVLRDTADLTISAAGEARESQASPDNTPDVVVGESVGEGLTVDASGADPLVVGLPFEATAESLENIGAGNVAYDNGNGSTTVPLVKSDGSVQITTVIDGADSPTAYPYEFELGAGDHIEVVEAGGAMVIGSDGSFIAGIAPPWAVDSSGTPVSTHYEVQGTTLVQFVDHAVPGVSYPVVADPWLGVALISSWTWSSVAGKGWKLNINPTPWARLHAPGQLPAWAGWSEVLSKVTPKSRVQTATMEGQYICHATFAFADPQWNLEAWRPAGSIAQQIGARCNIGG